MFCVDCCWFFLFLFGLSCQLAPSRLSTRRHRRRRRRCCFFACLIFSWGSFYCNWAWPERKRERERAEWEHWERVQVLPAAATTCSSCNATGNRQGKTDWDCNRDRDGDGGDTRHLRRLLSSVLVMRNPLKDASSGRRSCAAALLGSTLLSALLLLLRAYALLLSLHHTIFSISFCLQFSLCLVIW